MRSSRIKRYVIRKFFNTLDENGESILEPEPYASIEIPNLETAITVALSHFEGDKVMLFAETDRWKDINHRALILMPAGEERPDGTYDRKETWIVMRFPEVM